MKSPCSRAFSTVSAYPSRADIVQIGIFDHPGVIAVPAIDIGRKARHSRPAFVQSGLCTSQVVIFASQIAAVIPLVELRPDTIGQCLERRIASRYSRSASAYLFASIARFPRSQQEWTGANNSSKLWAGEAVMQNAATTDKSNFFIHFQFNGFKTFRKIEKIPPP